MNYRTRQYSNPPQQRPQVTRAAQKTSVAFKDPLSPWNGLHTVPWIAMQQLQPQSPRKPSIPKYIAELYYPLAKPSRTNNYHGFCKGSWLSRGRSVKEGISIAYVPTGGLITTVPHWQCKKCSFKSQAQLSALSRVPNNIFFGTSGIRYRWTLLLKSHAKCKDSLTKTESYSYRYIFCAAEGKPTATYGGLDTLVEHVVAGHSRDAMSAKVLTKTRTVVGRVAEAEDQLWDVNLPEPPVEMNEPLPGGPYSNTDPTAVSDKTICAFVNSLIFTPDLYKVYAAAIDDPDIGAERYKRNLRRMISNYGKELTNEASRGTKFVAARLLRSRKVSERATYEIVRRTAVLLDSRRKRQDRPTRLHDSDSLLDSSEDEPSAAFGSGEILVIRESLLSSKAYTYLKADILDFVHLPYQKRISRSIDYAHLSI